MNKIRLDANFHVFLFFSSARCSFSPLARKERKAELCTVSEREAAMVLFNRDKREETIDVDATISEVSRTRTFKTLILISPVVFPQGKILAKIWLKILRRLDKQVGGKTSAELL